MKTNPVILPSRRHPWLIRLGVTLVLATLALALAGCGERDSWLPFGRDESTGEKALKTLEAKFEELKAGVTGSRDTAVAFWQASTALFVLVSGIALVGGAALGSRARRANDRHQRSEPVLSTPDLGDE